MRQAGLGLVATAAARVALASGAQVVYDHDWAIQDLRGLAIPFGSCLHALWLDSFRTYFFMDLPLSEQECAAGGYKWYQAYQTGAEWEVEAAASRSSLYWHALRPDVDLLQLLDTPEAQNAAIYAPMYGKHIWFLSDVRFDRPEVVFTEKHTLALSVAVSAYLQGTGAIVDVTFDMVDERLSIAGGKPAPGVPAVDVKARAKAEALADKIRQIAARNNEWGPVDVQVQVEGTSVTVINAPHELVRALATDPDVRRVHPRKRLALSNADVSAALQSGFYGDATTSLADVKAKFKMHQAGVDGTGQIVTVVDTGLDMNNCLFRDGDSEGKEEMQRAAERAKAPLGTVFRYPNHRKVSSFALFSGDHFEGHSGGHGTHVAGTVAGSIPGGTLQVARGVAPGARLAFVDIGDVKGSLYVNDVVEPFASGYDDGSRIFTNSYGDLATPYSANSVSIDAWLFSNQDSVTLWAAGNSGDLFPFGTVSGPGNAKSSICVGASQSSSRGFAEYRKSVPKRFCNQPAVGDQCGDAMAAFSGAGPTPDGRQKPDLVAPGHVVLSAASSEPINGVEQPSCSASYMSGTSMSTPAVAGAAAMLRQWFMDGFYPSGQAKAEDAFTPMGALLKAVLMHNAHVLPNVPETEQGAGVPDLWATVQPSDGAKLTVFGDMADMPGLAKTGQTWSRFWRVPETGAGTDLRATLAWYDFFPFELALTTLVNDLDLEVRGPRGAIFRVRGKLIGDRLNTAEHVVVPAAQLEAGAVYEVRVTAVRINFAYGDPQPFALAVTTDAAPVDASTVNVRQSGCSSSSVLVVNQREMGASNLLNTLVDFTSEVLARASASASVALTTVDAEGVDAETTEVSAAAGIIQSRIRASAEKNEGGVNYLAVLEEANKRMGFDPDNVDEFDAQADDAAPTTMLLVADGVPTGVENRPRASSQAACQMRKLQRKFTKLTVLCEVRDWEALHVWARRTVKCLCDATFDALEHARHVEASADRMAGLMCGTADELVNPAPSPCKPNKPRAGCKTVKMSSFGARIKDDPFIRFRTSRSCVYDDGKCTTRQSRLHRFPPDA